MSLTKKSSVLLLQIAKQSIQHGLDKQQALAINPTDYAIELQEKRATFVTLEINQQLRGCIGTLTAYQPLINDVAYHAHAAAFSDSRFLPLKATEFPLLDIHISVLGTPKLLNFDSETDLINKLRPKIDGLILTEGRHKSTFLPSVWDSLTKPQDFLRHLKQKAGLSANYWSDSIKIEHYTVDYIS